jgi:hypothetical protein
VWHALKLLFSNGVWRPNSKFAVQAGNWPLTMALYEQQAALLRSAGMKYKLLTHLYTYSTLLYVRCMGLVLCRPPSVSSHLQHKQQEHGRLQRQLHPHCRHRGKHQQTSTLSS